MDIILEVVGWLIILGIMTMLVVAAGNAPDKAAVLYLLPWALPSMFIGVLIVAFGSMLTQLKAIRVASERTAGLLADRLSKRTPAEPIFGRDG